MSQRSQHRDRNNGHQKPGQASAKLSNGTATPVASSTEPTKSPSLESPPTGLPPYTPPIALVLRVLGVGTSLPVGDRPVTVSAAGLRSLLKWLVRDCDVDEAWYEQTYPDIAAAKQAGKVKSCRSHFIEAGYLEGRRPSASTFDESWYLTQYPDIAEAIRAGLIASAVEHFENQGCREGRAPIREQKRDADLWREAAQATNWGCRVDLARSADG